MRGIVDRFERLLGVINAVVRRLVVFALLSMTGVLFLNSIGRSVLNLSFVGGPALSRLLVIWLTFLGAYLAVRSGTHITVDVLQRLLSARALRRLAVPIGLCAAATMGYVTWLSALFTQTRFAAGQIDPMLEIPTAVFYLPVPVGTGLMTLAFLQAALHNALGDTDADAAPRPPPDAGGG